MFKHMLNCLAELRLQQLVLDSGLSLADSKPALTSPGACECHHEGMQSLLRICGYLNLLMGGLSLVTVNMMSSIRVIVLLDPELKPVA